MKLQQNHINDTPTVIEIFYHISARLSRNIGYIHEPYTYNGLFESLIQQTKNKKGSNECFLFIFGADYETRSARFCARRHAPDRRTVPRTVLCFATVFSSLSYHKRKIKKEAINASFFIFGADYETRTRYLHLGKVTLYRMS